MLHFSASSAKPSSDGNEIPKESRSYTVHRLYRSVQLRSKLHTTSVYQVKGDYTLKVMGSVGYDKP